MTRPQRAGTYAYAAQQSADQSHLRINQLSREVVMLRTALTVLTQTLKDSVRAERGQSSTARLENAMELVFPTSPAQPEPVPPAQIRYTCIKCRQQVPREQHADDGDGPTCERCPGL